MPSHRLASRIAWTLWMISLLAAAVVWTLIALNWSTPVPDIWGVRGSEVITWMTFSTVGAVIASRRPENPIGWIFCAVALLQAAQNVATEYANYSLLTQPDSLPGGVVAAWFANWIWVVFVGLVLVYFVSLFPDGHFLSPRWRWVAWLGAIGIAALALTFAFYPGPLTSSASFVENPYGVGELENRLVYIQVAFSLYLIPIAAAAASLILRFRRARGEERQQLKWLASAAALVGLSIVFQPIFNEVKAAQVMTLITITAIPLASGFAIIKYRLYDIDIIINRTLVYGVLTATLAGTYFGSVVLLQMAFRGVTGQGNAVAIVISTLAIAALFIPLRRRIQGIIDRRFFRRRYDAALTLAAFADRMRDEVDVERLTGEPVEVVHQTMQPEHVSLSLRSGQPAAGRSAE